MYRRDKSLVIRGCASSMCNNLSVINKDVNGPSVYAVVYKAVVILVTTGTENEPPTHKQVIFKEPTAAHGQPLVLQAKLIQLGERTVLVATSQKGIQMYEGDGSVMLHWHALTDPSNMAAQVCFARGICAVGNDIICVGTSSSLILAFRVPIKGPNITVSEELKGHQYPICDLASYKDKMASSDSEGNIILWKQNGSKLIKTVSISGSGSPCSSLCLSDDVVVGGYGSGHIRVYNSNTGKIGAEVSAHARWITALSFNRASGLLLSAAEDSFVNVWLIKPGALPHIEHRFTDCITDQQLVGASFIKPDGSSFCVTGYDNNEISMFTR
ncbi:WD repeat domain 54-like [Tubulanus polymorphus]|uniref:WD repeat domain 54-like n=1 Tax=Tubulanus polymorphus TaxID=672921 RepID=UPI003DA5D328